MAQSPRSPRSGTPERTRSRTPEMSQSSLRCAELESEPEPEREPEPELELELDLEPEPELEPQPEPEGSVQSQAGDDQVLETFAGRQNRGVARRHWATAGARLVTETTTRVTFDGYKELHLRIDKVLSPPPPPAFGWGWEWAQPQAVCGAACSVTTMMRRGGVVGQVLSDRAASALWRAESALERSRDDWLDDCALFSRCELVWTAAGHRRHDRRMAFTGSSPISHRV
jgi:hypothetical protein